MGNQHEAWRGESGGVATAHVEQNQKSLELLDRKVNLTLLDRPAMITGVHIASGAEPKFLLRYADDQGRMQEDWCRATEFTVEGADTNRSR